MRCFLRVIGLLALLGLAGRADATTIRVSYNNAGVQVADQAALCAGTTVCQLGTETFNSRTTADLTGGFTSTYVNNGAITITGTYSADATARSGSNLVNAAANQYGGVGLTGSYPQLFNGSYTITLSSGGVPGVNYFGLWISALDANNGLSFYSGQNLLLAFTPTQMINAINARADRNAYYGNPNNPSLNTGEPYAFVNFFAFDGTFDRVVFSNSNGTGFESDNHTVGYRNPSFVTGIEVPEPAGALVVAGAIAGLGWLRRRRG